MQTRTATTAASLMTKAVAWCREQKLDDESLIYSICCEAVEGALKISKAEERTGELYTKRGFQKRVERHNRRVEGITRDPRVPLWRRALSCILPQPEFRMPSGK
jgi:hypothetical protein